MKIFVIHARRTGYGVVRALKDFTKDIYVVDENTTPIFKSKYIKDSFICSNITQVSEEDFLQEMISIAKKINYKEEKPIVFTGKDDYLLFFSKHFNILSEYFDLSFEQNYELLKSALSKKELAILAKKSDVLIPKTFDESNSLDEIYNNISFPVIIKPAIKNSPEMDVATKIFRVKKCLDNKELSEAITMLNEYNLPYVVQEYIPGDDSELYTFAVYSYQGKIKGWSASKKLRQFPPNTGECSFGKTIYSIELKKAAEKILSVIPITGISQIEFKKYNNQFYLIEINPRIWSWHLIHLKDGINFAKIAIEHIHNPRIPVVNPNQNTVYWMFLWMDLLHNVILKKNISTWTWIKSFFKSDFEAFFDWSDFRPFYYHTKQTIPYIYQQLTNGKE